MLRTLIYLKSEMLIKSNCLRVLLIDGQGPVPIILDPGAKKLFSKALSLFRWGEDQHFQPPLIHTHKSNRYLLPRFGNHQMGNAADCLRNKLPDFQDFRVGKKQVCGTNGAFSDLQKFLHQQRRSCLYFINVHRVFLLFSYLRPRGCPGRR